MTRAYDEFKAQTHYASISNPERSEWVCHLFGTGPYGLVLRPLKGQEPNWFWRWMQYLCFGNEWRRT